MIAARIARDELARAWSEASALTLASLAAVVLLGAAALLAPLWGYAPGLDVAVDARSQGPSAAHLLGTDHLGRDLFWRMILSTRAFVGPGALSAGVAVGLGTLLGALGGWLGGPVAAAARLASGVLAALPRFVWVLLVCSIWGDSPIHLGVAVGVACAPAVAEAVHARLESLRTHEYVLASRAHGVPEWRLLAIHGLVAGCGRLILRHAVLCVGAFLVIETTLAYIGGFGVREPTPSLGNMLAFEWGWSAGAYFPAALIWAAVAAIVFLADGLRERADG